jgi:hypothetical protein
MIDGLPPGVELAIGGGDPLSHPDIHALLIAIQSRGLVANVTINGMHTERHGRAIHRFREDGLIRGLGISYRAPTWPSALQIADANTVIHMIAGVNTPSQAIAVLRQHPKILVLGYKRHGRGECHYGEAVCRSLLSWRYWIGSILRKGTVCFDNLAIEQLDVKYLLSDEKWQRLYMGDDGMFTMYADAVRDEFAGSSTSVRVPASGMTASEFFKSWNIHHPNPHPRLGA